MKRTILTLAAASLLAASCNPDVKYTQKPFVFFESALVTVPEDAGSVKIPVSVLGLSQNVNVGYELVTDVEDPSAHFALADPDNTILFFSPTKTKEEIEVLIFDEPGVRAVYSFTIKLISKSSGVEFGGYSSCKVTISDNDHPLKSILGEYTASDVAGNVWTMTFVADPDSDTNVLIDGLTPMLAGGYVEKGHMWTFKAAVASDFSAVRVSIGDKLPEAYEDLMPELLGLDAQGYFNTSGTIDFRKNEEGYTSNMGAYLGIVDWKAGRIISQVDYTEPPVKLVKK